MLVSQKIAFDCTHHGLLTTSLWTKNNAIVLIQQEVDQLGNMVKVDHALIKAYATLAFGHYSQDISNLV